MIACLVIRRFRLRVDGEPRLVRLAKLVNVACVPERGDALDFQDGSGSAGVTGKRLRAWDAPRAPGLYPVACEVLTGSEDDTYQRALDAGWTAVDDAP